MPLTRITAHALDWAMCASMYAVQRRHRLHARSQQELTEYITSGEGKTRDEFYGAAAMEPTVSAPDVWNWESPVHTAYPRNDRAHVRLFPSAAGWSAPTVIMLHALMSASDRGYAAWGAQFNRRGWNACFVHLPYHYSRVPPGFWNGELAITSDLKRTGEGLRQGVTEVRQLLQMLRTRGGREFGLWACSYGGWIGALLASVEEFRFTILMEPIVDVAHAIWHSPAGLSLRRELRRFAIPPELIARSFPLISPLYAPARGRAEDVLLIAGTHDRIAPAAEIARLHTHWAGSSLLTVEQGHFGYRMMPTAWRWLDECGYLSA